MNDYDLSILIPARNEVFLSRTVESILKNKRGKTEIIVGLDGEWADPQLEDHKDLRIVYYPKALGQRAMTNQLCRISTAKYVMKIDAHCAVGEGFDVKLMEDMQDNWTVVPLMKNLHAFNWKCPRCGNQWDQSPTPRTCMRDGSRGQRGRDENPDCDNVRDFEKVIIWEPRKSPSNTSFRFDKTLHFQYFGEYKRVQERTGSHIVDTMSLQGSCFMLTREKYWELDICDEKHGSWGQQGTEVACKTWLSGGEVKVNKKTWYAHMFRTQGGDFGFPYELKQKDVNKAREYSKQLFLEGKWEKAIHPLSWLIKKFSPVPGWEDEYPAEKSIIFYTDNQLNLKIAHAVQRQLRTIGLPIVSTSLKPMKFGHKNIHINKERGYLTMFEQILAALVESKSKYVFFCEHDVLYHPSHFDFTPPSDDTFYYNHNWWKVRDDGVAAHWDADQVSGICVNRELAIDWYRKRLNDLRNGTFDRKFEPMSRKGAKSWKSKYPLLDIRHTNNLTKSKWSLDDFRDKSTSKGFKKGTLSDIPGWDFSKGLLGAVALE